jgi:Tfp pilus assembly protein PilF
MLKTYINLGQKYYQQKSWKEALLNYQKAIEIQPNLSLIHYQVGDIYWNLQQWENAIAAFQKEITINPDFPWSYFFMGNSLIQFLY